MPHPRTPSREMPAVVCINADTKLAPLILSIPGSTTETRLNFLKVNYMRVTPAQCLHTKLITLHKFKMTIRITDKFVL